MLQFNIKKKEKEMKNSKEWEKFQRLNEPFEIEEPNVDALIKIKVSKRVDVFIASNEKIKYLRTKKRGELL